MDLQNYTQLAHTLQTVAIASLVFAACVFLPKINYLSQLTRLPSLEDSGKGEKQRQEYLQSAKKMYQDGYKKFTDKVYRLITSDGEEVVVPPKFLPELRKLPDDVLSFAGSIEQLMEVRYTKIMHDDPIVPLAVRADLTPALVRLNPIICQEVDSAIREEMPQCKEWTAVPMYMKLANIVAKVSGRVFVGPELCHDPEYIQLAVNYTIHLIEAQQRIKQMRPFFRPFLASRLPEIRRLRDGEAKAAKFIEPMIQARKDAQASDPNYQKPDDCLQWIMDRTEAMGRMDSAALLGKRQLGLTFAAIHTTTISTLNILYSLAVDQEAIQPLRDEVCKALADHDGVLTSRALQQMEKLDSYMKETMRFFPPGMTSFGRKVLKGITLSNGQYLPPGARIEVPSIAIYSDPSNYGPDVEKFDGLRHYKLRKQGTVTDHARNQFVTTNEANLGFGYGRHACPGRFFAANEIKMILSRLVLEYDFRNVDGEEGERYSNLEVGRQSSPDPRKVLMFKKVDI